MAVYAPGSALVANTEVAGYQYAADIARLAGGGYVVAWTGDTASGTDAVRVRVYGADGRPVSGEIPVGTGFYGSVSPLAAGGFAVAFGDVVGGEGASRGASSIGLRLFDGTGAARSDATVLDAAFDPDFGHVLRHPVVATLADGRIAVAWAEDVGSGTASHDTVGQILNADGSAATGRLQLGPTVDNQFGFQDIDISALPGGGFALVRDRFDREAFKSSVGSVEAQFFGADGQATSGVITVAPNISEVSTATLPDGRIVVGYGSGFVTLAADGTPGAFHRPTSDGSAINLATGPVELAALPDGNLLLTYSETGNTVAGIYTPDGSKIGLSIKDAGYVLPAVLSQDTIALFGAVFPAFQAAVDQSDVFTRVIRAVTPTDDPDGTPLANDAFYLARNGDVAAAGQDPDQHYHLYGWREGRDPDALFGSDAYRFANADVRDAAIDPLEHYHVYGWREGRDPSAAFDTQLYLSRNADVRAAAIDPFEHYLQYGRAEGREAFAAIGQAIGHGSFDGASYLLANPDVAKAGLDPYRHYLADGIREGRDPNAYFDTSAYLDSYADVAAAGIDPLQHYDLYGWREGRDPSGLFDTANYLQANADVAAAGIDPLTHYLRFGAAEGRSPLGDGSFD